MTKEKKQMVVMGALVLVVVAVGAFQFMGKKPAPVVDDSAKKSEKQNEQVASKDEDPEKKLHDYVIGLADPGTPPRDPFAPQAVLIDNEGQQGETTSVAPKINDPGPTMPRPEIDDPGVYHPPFDGGEGPKPGAGTVTIEPQHPMFALRGVMIGKRRMCMMELSDGRQVTLLEGQTFGKDAETTIVQITESYVVLNHRGQNQTLPLLGGN